MSFSSASGMFSEYTASWGESMRAANEFSDQLLILALIGLIAIQICLFYQLVVLALMLIAVLVLAAVGTGLNYVHRNRR